MIHECKRCNGWGGICKCGRPRQLIKRQKACPSCGTRAMSQPCPGFVAGVIVKGRFLRPEVVPTASTPHHSTFATCDCCGIRANTVPGEMSRMWAAWKMATRKIAGKDVPLHVCTECSDRHEQLIGLAIERLFEERERAAVGIGYRGRNPEKLLHPNPPRWLRCDGCGHDFGKCHPLWQEQRKCCPDCTHGSGPDEFYLRQPISPAALLTVEGVNLLMGFIPFDGPVDDVLRADAALQLAEDIDEDETRRLQGINAPPGAD